MREFAFLLILVALLFGIVYYYIMCRKMANIKAEAENYIEQKDFEGSSSDEEADIVADPNSPMSKMIHDMTVEMGDGLSPQSGTI